MMNKAFSGGMEVKKWQNELIEYTYATKLSLMQLEKQEFGKKRQEERLAKQKIEEGSSGVREKNEEKRKSSKYE